MKKLTNALKSFDIEFQPFIEEINAKEGAIREYADAVTMERVRSKYGAICRDSVEVKSNACEQVLRVFSRILHQS